MGLETLSLQRRTLLTGALAGTALVGLTGFRSFSGLFAPSAELWDRWTAHDDSSAREVDYDAWTSLLGRYASKASSGVVVFDYGGVSAADRATLQEMIAAWAAVPVSSLNRAEQQAFWINLYNAATVELVLRHYPVESIRDTEGEGGFLSKKGPWDIEVVRVEDEPLTLNDIEHRILRPIWRDPRIHYAVNCASIGCPNLKLTAWTAEAMEADLENAARAYVNDPRGVRIDGGQVTVSSIYDWFIEDFGRSEELVLVHLKRYADPGLAEQLGQAGKIDGTAYDWRLNRQS